MPSQIFTITFFIPVHISVAFVFIPFHALETVFDILFHISVAFTFIVSQFFHNAIPIAINPPITPTAINIGGDIAAIAPPTPANTFIPALNIPVITPHAEDIAPATPINTTIPVAIAVTATIVVLASCGNPLKAFINPFIPFATCSITGAIASKALAFKFVIAVSTGSIASPNLACASINS